MRMWNQKSPVPLTPEKFAEKVKSLHFTSARTDCFISAVRFAAAFAPPSPQLASNEFGLDFAVLTGYDCLAM